MANYIIYAPRSFLQLKVNNGDSKTYYMVFKPRQKKQLFEFHVSIDEQPIPRVSEPCFWVSL